MYAPAAFKIHPALALAFASARGFGLVVACDGGRPVAAPLPFHLIETHGKSPRAIFHVARGNPLAALAAKRGEWLIAVQGADAYVSAGWYVTPEQVPTWLYETVQLAGPAQVVPDEHARAHLDVLTARFEHGAADKPPWTSARLSAERLTRQLHGIVVIEMLVATVEGKFKLNQNKADADHVAVVEKLAGSADPGARNIAARMVALRPHLMYQNQPERPAAVAEDVGGL